HGEPALLLGAVLIVWLLAMTAVLRVAEVPGERTGDLLAVFPPGVDGSRVLAAVAASEGVVMRGTWFGNVWEVRSDAAGFAGRLRQRGALLVLPPLPLTAFTLGGCSWLPATAYDRPAIRRMPPAPM
ncbi:MAG TPA: hypothetical protein VFG43_01585, partial [Geminicoccaceae bacterium]|nr:hypothetical protein [Geminicoccaceae bacterium]